MAGRLGALDWFWQAVQGGWQAIGWWIVITLIASVITFGLLWLLICSIPVDYFLRDGARPEHRHPVLHALWVVVRNALGVVMLGVGIAFTVLPGPGVPWILLGLGLMDFPAKRRVLRSMTKLGSVQACFNWLRRKGGRPPLMYPPGETPES